MQYRGLSPVLDIYFVLCLLALYHMQFLFAICSIYFFIYQKPYCGIAREFVIMRCQLPHSVLDFCITEKSKQSDDWAISSVTYSVSSFLLLYPKHAISNANMCLDILYSIFLRLQFFPQCCHKNSERSNIIIRTSSPNLLGNIGMCQYLSHIAGQKTEQLIFYRCQMQFFSLQICAACRIVYL